MINAADVKYGAAPAMLPPGAQLGVLRGDPNKAGRFTMRLKMPDGYKVAPHWHPNDEDITVLEGNFFISMSDGRGENEHRLERGGFHFIPAKAPHSVRTQGETVIEIHATGPFDLHYLNPADDPRSATALKK